MGRRAVVAAVTVMLGIYAALALTASAHKGLSYDEGEELVVGYDIWLHHDFRMEAANGDLIKRWATLPYLFSHPNFPSTEGRMWRLGAPYELGYQFFFQSGNEPRALLLQGRMMVALLGVATGLLVFLCSRELFGDAGGLLSLTLFVFSPHMLAYGGVVSTEMSLCLTLLAATWCIWRLLHRVSWSRLVASLLCCGLLLLAKLSSLAIVPLAAVLVGLRLWRGRPMIWQLFRARLVRSRRVQASVFAALLVLHVGVGWTAIWAHYEFRYEASPRPADASITFRPVRPVQIDALANDIVSWCRRTHFLPRGFLHGVKFLMMENDVQTTFVAGEWKRGGWWKFFPYAMWVKTPPALLAFVLLAAAGLGSTVWASRRAERRVLGDHPLAPEVRRLAYHAIPFLSLIVVFLALSILQDLDIGFRHILPIYPALFVLAGAAVLAAPMLRRWATPAFLLFLLWLAGDSVAIYPHYLSYFSPVAGGPAEGYKHLVDSSVDWGMDLPELRQWLAEHNPRGDRRVYLAYFGTGSPEFYGINSTRLPCRPNWRNLSPYTLEPGIYAISATMLQGMGLLTVGHWNRFHERLYQQCIANLRTLAATEGDPPKRAELLRAHPWSYWDRQYSLFDQLRFGRLCARLRKIPPDDNVGYSILIWNLDAPTLAQAVEGPPPELEDRPLGFVAEE